MTKVKRRKRYARRSRPVVLLIFKLWRSQKSFYSSRRELYLKGRWSSITYRLEIVPIWKTSKFTVSFWISNFMIFPIRLSQPWRFCLTSGCWLMTNVHAAGGVEWWRLREGLGKEAKLIAVTQLTSTSEGNKWETFKIFKPVFKNQFITMPRKLLKRDVWFAQLKK